MTSVLRYALIAVGGIALFAFACAKKDSAERVESGATEIPGKAITIDFLRGMFESIEAQGDWDMSKPMLWGYFFTHHEPKQLKLARARLVSGGYRFVDIFLAEKEEADAPDLWFLHVEKEEIHTPESLDKRNDVFYVLAHELRVDAYDGMDVGPLSVGPLSAADTMGESTNPSK